MESETQALSGKFGEKLQEIREKAGVELAIFADLLGQTVEGLSAIEEGTSVPPREVSFYESLRKVGVQKAQIAELFTCTDSPQWLLRHESSSVAGAKAVQINIQALGVSNDVLEALVTEFVEDLKKRSETGSSPSIDSEST